MTHPFDTGDRVQIAIPDPTDPDHHHHGRPGRVVAIQEDDYSTMTGDPRDAYLYQVRFIDEETARYGSVTAISATSRTDDEQPAPLRDTTGRERDELRETGP